MVCQAPLRPKKASNAATESRPRSLDDAYAVPHQQNKAPTKLHKRHVKHATLLSRLQRTAADSRVKKRRRPSQKLVTDLSALGDALPESREKTREAHDGLGDSGKTRHRSLKSRPGAMKRKEKLLVAERQRFDQNLAMMAFGPDNANIKHQLPPDAKEDQNIQSANHLGTTDRTRAKWTAIREHILRTMETKDHIPTPK